jgi:hypothetical protein
MRPGLPLITTTEKVCAIITIPLGVLLLIQGAIGVFFGASFHYSLPPVLGFIPAIIGGNMCISIVRYWKLSNAVLVSESGFSGDDFNMVEFEEFLSEHPEFIGKTDEVKWKLFRKWKDRHATESNKPKIVDQQAGDSDTDEAG